MKVTTIKVDETVAIVTDGYVALAVDRKLTHDDFMLLSQIITNAIYSYRPQLGCEPIGGFSPMAQPAKRRGRPPGAKSRAAKPARKARINKKEFMKS